MPKNSYTFKLTPDQQDRLERLLQAGNYRPIDVPHTRIAVDGPDCKINLYQSGKCLVQGKGAEDWVTFTLEPEIMGEARLGYEDVLDPTLTSLHMGIDESGKGDFFGPLVIAGACVDEDAVHRLRDLGVRDSKQVKSEARIRDLARSIRKTLGGRVDVVSVGPEAYNRLYRKMGNVNRLLAWGHARVIENILVQVPDCPRAVSDQFGPTHRIERALLREGRRIQLEQRPRAESDPAVAAASILAREGFLNGLQRIGGRVERTLPKGASSAVKETARDLVGEYGPDILEKVSKMHFRTAREVLAACGYSDAAASPAGGDT